MTIELFRASSNWRSSWPPRAESSRLANLRLLTVALAAASVAGAWAQDGGGGSSGSGSSGGSSSGSSSSGSSGGGGYSSQDPSPYYIGASQSITRDSNVYRTPEAKADTYYSTGLLGGIDQPFGRQRFYLAGNVQLNRYQNEDTQNNTSYGLKTGLDWSTIERISGNVNVSLNQGLVAYGGAGPGTVPLQTKNIVSTDQFGALVQWGEASLLSLNAGYTYSQLSYSAEEYQINELNQDAITVGAIYRPSALVTLGAGLRHTRGTYPKLSEAVGNKFTRNDLDLTTTWIPTGRSTISGRLSIGRQSYEGGSARDFSGLTGSLAWDYKPTGKLSFNTVFERDTGNETSFSSLSTGTGTTPVLLSGDNSRITNSLRVTAAYLATAKIRATASLRYVQRSLADSNVVTSAGQASFSGSDSVRGVTLGVRYLPARNWQLACNVARDSRSASQEAVAGNLSYSYSVNTATCSAQFTFR